MSFYTKPFVSWSIVSHFQGVLVQNKIEWESTKMLSIKKKKIYFVNSEVSEWK